nr:SLAM family member 6-like isoform X2 [Microcebus murinus]
MATQVHPAQLLLLLLLLQFQKGHVVSQNSLIPSTVNGVLGESVTLTLKFPEGKKVSAITWLFNGTSIAFINLDEAKSPFIQMTDPKWKKRLNFTQSNSLHLSNLTMADTGSYSAHMTTETSVTLSSYTLRVFERLPRPRVTVDSIIYEKGTCNATFRCSVEEGGENIIYGWTPVGPGTVVSWVGSFLSDSWSLSDLDWTYTCTVRNPVSNSSSTLILPGQLCAGSKATEGTYCPVKWIFLGKGLLLLVFLGVLGTWHIQTQVLSKPLRSNSD